MKKFLFSAKKWNLGTWCLGIVLSLGALTFTSCSKDNDNEENGDGNGNGNGNNSEIFEGSLDDAPYKGDAVKFQVKGNDDYGIIELLASGNYLILPPDDGVSATAFAAPMQTMKAGLFRSAKEDKMQTRAIDTEEAYFGTFTKTDGGSYTLNGFGTLIVGGDTQVTLTPTGGQSVTLTVERVEPIASDELNDRLERTWVLESATVQAFTSSGYEVYSEEYTSEEDLKEQFVKYLILSGSYTFLQIEWNDTTNGYGVWNWRDRSKQIFDYEWKDDPTEEGGTVQVIFSGNKADFIEEIVNNVDGTVLTMRLTQHCRALN